MIEKFIVKLFLLAGALALALLAPNTANAAAATKGHADGRPVAEFRLDAQPIVPSTEQIENSPLYFERANQTWFLFCNHIGIENKAEFTDAIWVYWTKGLNHWNPAHKAVVLDGTDCRWSRK